MNLEMPYSGENREKLTALLLLFITHPPATIRRILDKIRALRLITIIGEHHEPLRSTVGNGIPTPPGTRVIDGTYLLPPSRALPEG